MTTRRPYPGILALLIVAALTACGGQPRVEEPEPETLIGWRVLTAEHIALWYHGLAYARSSGAPLETTVLPRFAPGYVERIVAIKRREGKYPTPLDERAAEFGRIFRGSDVYQGLEFLPLYFRDAEALYSGIDLWNRAGGNPYNAGSAAAAQVVAFLAQLFPRPAERQAVVEWVALLREEDRAFHDAYWASRADELATAVASVQREWDEIAPAFREYLEYIRFRRGELILVPALGAEGRTVAQGTVPRVAVLEPPAERPEDAVWSFVHELLYPLVGDVIRENVAPARIRELGEERLASLAAVRGGAILLQRAAPGRLDDYRRFFLEAAGHTTRLTNAELERAFNAAFPLEPALLRGLETTIELAFAGI